MNYFEYVILSTVAAVAADLTFTTGLASITGQGVPIEQAQITEWRKDAYAAGTASDKSYDLSSGPTLQANTKYELKVVTPDLEGDTPKERSWFYWSGDSAPTAADLVDAFVAAINGDNEALVTAVDATASIQLTLDDVATGDFNVRFYRDDVQEIPAPTVNTPYVAPQGTPALVAEATGDANVSSTGQFTRYEVDWLRRTRHNEVNGAYVYQKVTTALFIDETDGDAAALITAIDDVFDGTHATVADFLGKPQG
jgi:hypothetical protein